MDRPGQQDPRFSRERALRISLIQLPRRAKRIIMLGSDVAGVFGCVALCLWLNLIYPVSAGDLAMLATATLLVALALTRYLGFYHSIVRYLGMGLLMASARVAVGSAIALALFAWLSGMTTQPIQLAVVYGAFCGLFLVGSRYLAQFFLVRRSSGKGKVIIYGAGEAGARVVQAMQGAALYHPIAFIDDNPALQGNQINGLTVYPRSSLPFLTKKHDVARVLLAIPSASRRERQEIIADLEELSVHVQTVPDFVDLISGKARVDEIRDVDVEDLLGRPPVAPNERLMEATLLKKSVLVTGAGGRSAPSCAARSCELAAPAARAVRNMRVGALRDRQGAAGAVGENRHSVRHRATARHRYRTIVACSEVMAVCVSTRCTTRRPTSTCPSWSTTSIEGVLQQRARHDDHRRGGRCESVSQTFVLISTDKAVARPT